MKNPIVGELVIYDPAKMPRGTYPQFRSIRWVHQFDDETDCEVAPYSLTQADNLCRFVWTFAGPVVVYWRERDPSSALSVLPL